MFHDPPTYSKVPSKARLSEGPQCNRVMTPGALGGRKGGGSKHTQLYAFLESYFPPAHRGADTRPRPTSPAYQNTPGSPSISPSFRLLPQVRTALRSRPRTQHGSLSSGSVSEAGRLAHPPAPRSSQPRGGRMPGQASEAPPGPTCKAGEGSACSPKGELSHREKN